MPSLYEDVYQCNAASGRHRMLIGRRFGHMNTDTDRLADHNSGWMMPHFQTNIGYCIDPTAILQQLHSREAFKGRLKIQSDPLQVVWRNELCISNAIYDDAQRACLLF